MMYNHMPPLSGAKAEPNDTLEASGQQTKANSADVVGLVVQNLARFVRKSAATRES
jgi:hypothetical protein